MFFVPHERDAIERSGAKVISISNAQQPRDGRALIIGRHLVRIRNRAQRDGACFWRIGPNDVITYDIP